MLVCDTSGLIAYFDASDAYHADISAAIDEDPGPFAVSPYVLAEVDYLLATRRGAREELVAVRELSGGAWELPAFDSGDVRQAADIIERYGDQNIGLADASLVILAARYRTDRLLTLDHRHFRVIRTASGRPFTLVP
ncbi:MAG: PIN domain-containing protein [Streptosporangiaceae bacterium]